MSSSRFGAFLKTAGRYYSVISWLFRDAVWRFKARAITILVVGFLGGVFQAGALGQAVYYSRIMERGKALRVLGMEFDPRTSIELLIIFAGGVSVAFLISGLMVYYSRSRAIKAGCAYESLCSQRILSVLGISQNIPTYQNGKPCADADILRLASTDSRFCGRVLRLLLNVFMPATTFVLYSGLLFYIHAGVTVVVFVMVGISAFFMYKTGLFAARSSILFERQSPLSKKEKGRILKRLKGATTDFPDEHKSWIRQPYDSGEIKSTMNAYAGRLLAVEYSTLINNVLGASVIAIILLFFGASAILHATGWGVMIVYLIAFRSCLANLKQATRTMTSINRFYPQLRRYHYFVTNVDISGCGDPVEPGPHALATESDLIDESLKNWVVRKGQRIGLISPVRLSRYTLAFLVDCLFSPLRKEMEEIISSTWFVTERYGPPPIGLRRFLHLEPGATRGSLRAEMETLGIWEQFNSQMPSNLEEPVPPEVWKKAETSLKFALALLAARRSGAWWIMIEERGLNTIDEEKQSRLLEYFAGCIVVIVFDAKMKTVGNYGEHVFVVLGERGVVGFGPSDWVRQHEGEIRNALASALEQYAGKIEEAEEDDISIDDE